MKNDNWTKKDYSRSGKCRFFIVNLQTINTLLKITIVMERLIFSSLPMFVSGFWTILLLCTQFERHNRERLVLSMFMAVTTLLFFAHCVFFNEFHSLIPVADTVYSFAVLASYPMFYIFLVSISSSSQHLRRSWLLLLPAVFLGATVGVLYTMMSPDETADFITRCLYCERYFDFSGITHHMAIAHLIIKICFAITVICVLVSGSNRLVKYDKRIKAEYSNLEGKSSFPFKVFLYLFFLTSVASFVFNIVGRYNFESTFWALTLPSAVFSLLIFILGLIVLRQSFGFEGIDTDTPDHSPHDRDRAQAEELAKRIESVIEQQQLFLQPNLKVSDLAAQLCTNRMYISQAFNMVMQTTFSDYINKKRIEYATRIITTQPETPIADVAYESGFASLNSFYRNFKNFNGCSPMAFIRKIDTASTAS